MISKELKEVSCPKCSQKISHGYLAGHWFRLRWVDRPNTKTIFSGEVLRKKVD